VFEAGNGAEALAVLEQNQVDLILCDIKMPIMDGLEFVKQLAGVSNAKGIPVVMITTEGSESHVRSPVRQMIRENNREISGATRKLPGKKILLVSILAFSG
jgi:CheY-like chemotaxis protein